jgi:hypothetical protein
MQLPNGLQAYIPPEKLSAYLGSFHETAKVVNSIRVSTAGITQ